MEGLRIGGPDPLSGQREFGIAQAQCESVLAVHDKCDGPLRLGAYREAPIMLFQEALGCFSQGFDHQASVFVEDTVGSAVLRERVVIATRRHLQNVSSCVFASLAGGDGLVGQNLD
jgi:hypothetical protein